MRSGLRIAVWVLVIVLLGIGSSLEARDKFYYNKDLFQGGNKVGASTFAFLKIGVGARGIAMGDAYTAVGDDVSAIFWNPAGIGRLQGVNYLVSYNRWFVDTEVYAAALTYRVAKGVVGISLRSFRTGGVEERTIFQPTGTGRMVEGNAIVAGLTYAAQPTNKLSVGVRLRYARQTIFTQSSGTPIMDIGTHFHTGFKSIRLSMSLKNLGKDVTYVENSYYMPLNFTTGAAMEIYGNKEEGDPTYLTVAGEVAYAVDFAARAHIGGELVLAKLLAVRGGYKFNYDAESWTMGGGLMLPVQEDRNIKLDVAYTDGGELLNSPLRMTLSGNF